MGFKPVVNQQYFLVVKNSGMPLGVRAPHLTSPGAFIEQQNFEPEFVNEQPNPQRKRQYFMLENGDFRQVLFKPGGNNLYLDVRNSNSPDSHEDDALLIQYTRLGSSQLFQLISAGNGYYRVRSLHAPTKFWDVLGNKSDPGANLALVRYTGTENQLFALLPATPAGVAPDPRPLQRVNEDLRNTVLMVAGWVPSVDIVPVGTVLKFIIGFFWKGTDHEQDFWNQMKSYVDERVATLVLQEELKNMRISMNNELRLINDTSASNVPPNLKGGLIEKHIERLQDKQGNYLERREGKNAMQVMPYLVGMGTVLLTLLRQRIVNYDELYTSPEQQKDKAATLVYYKAQLRQTINRFTRAAVVSRIQALDWRCNQISNVTTTRAQIATGSTASGEQYLSSFTDRFDSWSPQLEFVRIHSRVRDTTTGWPEHKEMIEYLHEQRLAQAKVQFGTEIEAMLNGARLWKYFDNELTAPQTQMRTATVGSFGGRRAGTPIGVPAGVVITPNEDPSQTQGRITRIVVHTGSHGVVSGLEITYGDQSTGIMGSSGATKETIQLEANEFVTGVYGTLLVGIDSICFETSHGQRVTGGRPTGFTWSADLADVLGAALVRVTGTVVNNNIVERLSFEWAYAVLGDDLPRLDDIPTISVPASRPSSVPPPIDLAGS